MIRPEFFERNDLNIPQYAFLEFVKTYHVLLAGAAGAFEQNQPSAVLQAGRQAVVLSERVTARLEKFHPAAAAEIPLMFAVLMAAKRAESLLADLCEAGASPFRGMGECRSFLAELCRCLADMLDWSHKKQLLGPSHHGATEDDFELTLKEMPASLAVARDIESTRELLDFYDALRAARGLFALHCEIIRISDRLFPLEDDKYWTRQ